MLVDGPMFLVICLRYHIVVIEGRRRSHRASSTCPNPLTPSSFQNFKYLIHSLSSRKATSKPTSQLPHPLIPHSTRRQGSREIYTPTEAHPSTYIQQRPIILYCTVQ